MKWHFVFIAVLLVFGCVSMPSFNSNRLVGTWHTQMMGMDEYITFDDTTVIVRNNFGQVATSYTYDSEYLYYSEVGAPGKPSRQYKFLNDNTLQMWFPSSPNVKLTYTRQ